MTVEPHLSTELRLSLPQAGVQLRPGQEGGSARQLAEAGSPLGVEVSWGWQCGRSCSGRHLPPSIQSASTPTRPLHLTLKSMTPTHQLLQPGPPKAQLFCGAATPGPASSPEGPPWPGLRQRTSKAPRGSTEATRTCHHPDCYLNL